MLQLQPDFGGVDGDGDKLRREQPQRELHAVRNCPPTAGRPGTLRQTIGSAPLRLTSPVQAARALDPNSA